MKLLQKHKASYQKSLVFVLVGLFSLAALLSQPKTAMAAPGCFDTTVGVLYQCSTVPSPPSSPAGNCYIGTESNGQYNWTQQNDCSNSDFAGSAIKYGVGTQGSSFSACPAQDSNCDSLMQHYINPITTFLAIGVGIIVAIMIAVGGIQYAASGDNPQAVSAAKKRIINALIALVAFGLMYSLLQWLVPGGIFH